MGGGEGIDTQKKRVRSLWGTGQIGVEVGTPMQWEVE